MLVERIPRYCLAVLPCFARANTIPAKRPTAMLAMFLELHAVSNMKRPRMAMGSLLRDPTKLYVVAVVVERNQRLQKLMRKPQMALRQAAA